MHVKGFVKTLWFKILAVIMGILIIFLILADHTDKSAHRQGSD